VGLDPVPEFWYTWVSLSTTGVPVYKSIFDGGDHPEFEKGFGYKAEDKPKPKAKPELIQALSKLAEVVNRLDERVKDFGDKQGQLNARIDASLQAVQALDERLTNLEGRW
jgi:hypothetical protein